MLAASTEIGQGTNTIFSQIAGDALQRLVFDNDFSDWESLLGRLGLVAAANATLQLGYRSTAEVMVSV